MSLHLDYRPKDFDEFMGNKITVRKLQAQLKAKELPHSLMFIGPSGCGKTTLARILKNHLECSELDFIEINAGNNRGIETGRQIIANIRLMPIEGEVRIYLIDECFHESTLVKTPLGCKKIKDIKQGDFVFNIEGQSKVKKVFKNKVSLDRVAKVRLFNGDIIFCSEDHLFLTDRGWVKIKEINKRDLIFKFNHTIMESIKLQGGFQNEKNMSFLSSRIRDKKQRSKILLRFLQKQSKEKTSYHLLQILRRKIRDFKKREIYSKILFSIMHWKVEYLSSRDERSIEEMWYKRETGHTEMEKAKSRSLESPNKGIFREDENQQSLIQSQSDCKIQRNEKNKWNFKYLAWRTWWKWQINSRANPFGYCFGMVDGSSDIFREKKSWISNQLQSRYWESRFKNSNRSRWEWPSVEKDYCKRQKENLSRLCDFL
jgi:DNA polymerase III delta prime subunit